MAGLAIELDPAALKPLIDQAVTEALARAEAERAKIDGRLAYSEGEAARLIGLQPWQLRDERLRGRIQAHTVVGRRIRYLREELLRYLTSRPWQKP